MTKVCGDCVYFDTTKSADICRRNSPQPGLTGSAAVVWPAVDPVNDWCADGYNITDGTYNPAPVYGSR